MKSTPLPLIVFAIIAFGFKFVLLLKLSIQFLISSSRWPSIVTASKPKDINLF